MARAKWFRFCFCSADETRVCRCTCTWLSQLSKESEPEMQVAPSWSVSSVSSSFKYRGRRAETSAVKSTYASSTLARSTMEKCFFITSITSAPASRYLKEKGNLIQYKQWLIAWFDEANESIRSSNQSRKFYGRFKKCRLLIAWLMDWGTNTNSINQSIIQAVKHIKPVLPYEVRSAFPFSSGTTNTLTSGQTSLASSAWWNLFTPFARAS